MYKKFIDTMYESKPKYDIFITFANGEERFFEDVFITHNEGDFIILYKPEGEIREHTYVIFMDNVLYMDVSLIQKEENKND